MTLQITFLGGAGTVTGSKYLLEKDGTRILVDCGLFQGFKALRLRNWAPFPVPVESISAILLTHAHIDHSGYLPLIHKNGFRGPIYCTSGTKDLCAVLLPDCGHLQEREAEFANRRGFSRHTPALPLYTEVDAFRALEILKPVAFDEAVALPGGASARFLRAGHILGAASVVIEWDGRTIVFSGDIGRYDDPLMFDPVTPGQADYLVMESTYGDRSHDSADVEQVLAHIIGKTIRRGGTVVVPAFAVGRAQSLIYYIEQLKKARQLPARLPVYLDSPMAIDATEIFTRHVTDQKLPPGKLRDLGKNILFVRTGDESGKLTADPTPKVIISASGMATGGRVLYHLEHYAPDAKNTILFTGFQAGGTRGAAMMAGADFIKMHGKHIPVRAEVACLSMLSAHADRNELLRWAQGIETSPRQVFIVHGEPTGADVLRQSLEEKLGWSCMVPEMGQQVILA